MAEYLWSGQLWRMLVAVTRARHFIEIYGCVSEKSLWVLNVRCLQTLPVKKHMQGSMWPTLLLCLTFLQGQRDLETRRSPQQGDSLLLSGCSYSWTANKQACYIKQLLLRSLCTLTGFFYGARSCYRALFFTSSVRQVKLSEGHTCRSQLYMFSDAFSSSVVHAGVWRMASSWHCDESCLSHWGWRIDYLPPESWCSSKNLSALSAAAAHCIRAL